HGGTGPNGTPIPPVPGAASDTFATLGVFNQDQAPGGVDATDMAFTPNPPPTPFNTNSLSSFDANNFGWVSAGPIEQARAGYPGDGDLLLRVLIMQLTVDSTSNVRGTVVIQGQN